MNPPSHAFNQLQPTETLNARERKGRQRIGGISNLARWLWIEAQLAAPPPVQRIAIPWMHQGKEVIRSLITPWMPVVEMRGHNAAGELTVTYGGMEHCKPLLKSMLFDQAPIETAQPSVFIWRPGELEIPATTDLTILESSQSLIRRLARQNAITLPFRIQSVVSLQGDWQQIEQRMHRNIRHHMHRSIAAFNYDCEITHKEQDLERFYHEMYLPTVNVRHGELAMVLSWQEARQLQRHGWLCLIKRNDVCVCGWLGHVRRNIVECREIGVLDGDPQLFKQELVDIIMYLGMRWAHQQGYSAFGLGDGWPFLSGGFLAKRKWGSTASVSPDQHKQIWIGVQRDTPAVRLFIKSHPCVVVNAHGDLHSVVVVDDPGRVAPADLAEWRKCYATPGIGDPLVCSLEDLMQNANDPSSLNAPRAAIRSGRN